MAVDVLMVRHGQSEWNALGRWQGQADPPLSDLGRRQAVAASDCLGTVDAIFASDLERAFHTASIIGELLGVGPVLVDPRLRERDAGEWQGMTREEIDEAWPGYLSEKRRPPGWEPDISVLERAAAALHEIEQQVPPQAQVLVVTHGGLIYAVEQSLGAEFVRISNLHGRWLHKDGGLHRLGERVALIDKALTTLSGQV